MAEAAAFPKVRCTVTIGDETTVTDTNALAWYRAEKAHGASILTGLENYEYGAIAALCYAVTAAQHPEFLKTAGGNHTKALEAWLGMEPEFSVEMDPEGSGSPKAGSSGSS